MRATFAGQNRQQRKHAGIAGGAKGKRRQRVSAPTKRADDMAKACDGVERGVENSAAYGVIDQIEAAAGSMSGDIIGDRRRVVVDEGRAQLLDIRLVFGRAGREDLSAECARDLNCDVSNA